MANGYGSSTSSSSTNRVLNIPNDELIVDGQETEALQVISLDLSITEDEMPNARTSRSFVVTGTVGAKFTIIALQTETQKYYNFNSAEFVDGHTSSCNLIVEMSQKKYRNSIVFPEGSGDFVIKLMPFQDITTNFSVITKSITKLGTNATITFTPATNNAVNYATFPTSTSTGDVNANSNVAFNWDVNNWNGVADAGSFGLIVTNENTAGLPVIPQNYWYFTTTENVADNPAGDGEDSTTVTVADVTDLGVGTELYYYKGTTVPTNKAGSAVGTTTISAIDTETKTITFSRAVAFEDGETMTFRAYGKKAINFAIGVDLQFTSTVLSTTLLTQTVRADSDGDLTPSTTITLNDTLGISGGSTIKYRGFNVDNTSNNRVVSVATPDPNGVASDGAITVELAQTLKAGTVLSFNQVYKTVNLKGNVAVNKYPKTNRTINFDIDKIITVGTQS
jgi:hypothetical protein|tara:strand:+ start:2857 stop:4206 length:1350 start_codon:yes stop_codon:yes gene_type:complete